MLACSRQLSPDLPRTEKTKAYTIRDRPMPLVKRFLPPAHLTVLNFKPGQLKEWHKAVSAWFDDSISQTAQRVKPGPFQYYNPARFDPRGFVIEQAVTWNAFPKELLRLFGRTEALKKADEQWTLARYYSVRKGRPVRRRDSPELFKFFVRPHTEYCEWLVTRDPKTNAIQRVTFTSEPPELWFAAFGDEVPWVPHKSKFSGDRQAVARRYERF